MNVIHAASPLALIVGLLLVPSVAVNATQPVRERVIMPGDTVDGGGTYVKTGNKCTSSSTPSSKKDQAVADANRNLLAEIKGNYVCPGGDITIATDPSPAFTEGDCTFTYEANCQGNPAKTDVIAACTADITWSIECTEIVPE